MIKILFVCHGNICRSTMAQSYFQNMIEKKGLEKVFEIDSAATHRDEIGSRPHYGTVDKLREEGVPVVDHRARLVSKDDFEKFDYIIGMDSANFRDLKRVATGDEEKKVYKLLSFAGVDRDVADPWYTGDFQATWDDVSAGCNAFFKYLQSHGEI